MPSPAERMCSRCYTAVSDRSSTLLAMGASEFDPAILWYYSDEWDEANRISSSTLRKSIENMLLRRWRDDNGSGH